MTEYATRKARLHLGWDASVYCNPAIVKKLYEAKYYTRFAYVRYRRNVKDDASKPYDWPEAISKQELREHIEIGVNVSLVQFIVPEAIGGGLDYASGKKFGDAAGWNARELGAPEGTAVWCDAESFEHRSPDQILDYLRGWFAGCVKHDVEPCLYVGSGLGNDKLGYVTGEQLYKRLPYWKYWRAASWAPQIERRGYCIQQTMQIGGDGEKGIFPGTPGYPNGLTIDQNVIMIDHLYFEDRRSRGRNRFLVITGK